MVVGVPVCVSPLIYLQKETLVHMLRYFDFLQSRIQTLQSRLPPHCIPKQEPDTGTTSSIKTSTDYVPDFHINAFTLYVCVHVQGLRVKRTPSLIPAGAVWG